MTAPLDLAEVKARCEEAICADCGGAGQFGLRQHACDSCGGHEDAAGRGIVDDATAVRVLTDDVPALVAEVERLSADNARLLDNLRAWRDPVCDAIRARLSEISEENWRAGWLRDIEHCVWRDITTGSRDECFGDVTAASLKALSEIIGGWVYWPADSDSPAFVALDEWTAIHAEWLKTKAALRAAGGG